MHLLIDDAMVWTGSGAPPFRGKVLSDGQRSAAVAPQAESVAAANGAERRDAAGRFLMPGLVEGHAHLVRRHAARPGRAAARDRALLTGQRAQALGAGRQRLPFTRQDPSRCRRARAIEQGDEGAPAVAARAHRLGGRATADACIWPGQFRHRRRWT